MRTPQHQFPLLTRLSFHILASGIQGGGYTFIGALMLKWIGLPTAKSTPESLVIGMNGAMLTAIVRAGLFFTFPNFMAKLTQSYRQDLRIFIPPIVEAVCIGFFGSYTGNASMTETIGATLLPLLTLFSFYGREEIRQLLLRPEILENIVLPPLPDEIDARRNLHLQ